MPELFDPPLSGISLPVSLTLIQPYTSGYIGSKARRVGKPGWVILNCGIASSQPAHANSPAMNREQKR